MNKYTVVINVSSTVDYDYYEYERLTFNNLELTTKVAKRYFNSYEIRPMAGYITILQNGNIIKSMPVKIRFNKGSKPCLTA